MCDDNSVYISYSKHKLYHLAPLIQDFQKQEMADFLLNRLVLFLNKIFCLTPVHLSTYHLILVVAFWILIFFKVCTAIVPFSRISHFLANFPFTLRLSILPIFISPTLEKSFSNVATYPP